MRSLAPFFLYSGPCKVLYRIVTFYFNIFNEETQMILANGLGSETTFTIIPAQDPEEILVKQVPQNSYMIVEEQWETGPWTVKAESTTSVTWKNIIKWDKTLLNIHPTGGSPGSMIRWTPND